MKTVAMIIMYVFFFVQLSYGSLAYAEYPQVSDIQGLTVEEFDGLLFAAVNSIDWVELISLAESIDAEEYLDLINSINWERDSIDINSSLSDSLCYLFAIPTAALYVVGLVALSMGIVGFFLAIVCWGICFLFAVPTLIFCAVL
jgi:hypothetical protein